MTKAKRARRTTRRQRQRAKRPVTSRQRAKRSVITRQRPRTGTRPAPAARPSYALVAGERPELVLEGMLALRRPAVSVEDGSDVGAHTRYDLAANPDDLAMGPLLRALMRVEAELLLRDADELACASMRRSDTARRGNAFVLLARRVCEEMDRVHSEVPGWAEG
jgi:hypothetical protein